MKKKLIRFKFSYSSLKFFNKLFFFTIISLLFPTEMFSQTDTIYVPSDIPPGEGNFNRAVKAVIDTGSLSNTVFKLESNGYYVLTDSILVPMGEHLTIVAPELGLTQETAPPQILCTTGSNEFISPVRVMIKCFGDMTLKNLWLLFANTNGWQIEANLQFVDSPETVKEQVGIFENIIFDYSHIPTNSSGAVGIASKHFKGIFKNCYWRNCTDSHFRYYGRAVSFPYEYNTTSDWHIDSLVFENCTFANMGYVYMQENTHYADYVKFNHCTFLNVVMFTLESGWWWKMSVTNSLFVNTFMFGDIPAYHWYSPPFSYNEPNGGTIRIDSISTFGFEVPFNEQERRILFTNSSYFIEDWLADWMKNNPDSKWRDSLGYDDEIPVPQPMLSPGTLEFFESDDFPHMNMASLYDSTNPGFILAPSDTTAIKGFLYHKWFDCCDSAWAWKPENSLNQLWPLEENLAYTNEELKTAGMGGFPLGDLYRWWPEKYEQWKLQEEDENARISYWLETGIDSVFTDIKEKDEVVNDYELFQNYPNPFNPTTKIQYSIPRSGYISLKVFNILGQEVATLFEGYKQSGNYEVTFDGSKLASGVYFYKLRVGNFSKTKKLMLLK